MTNRTPTSQRYISRRDLKPVERALMLIALGLDPRFRYTEYEIQSAWRRRQAELPTTQDGNGVTRAAVNAAYLALVGAAPG